MSAQTVRATFYRLHPLVLGAPTGGPVELLFNQELHFDLVKRVGAPRQNVFAYVFDGTIDTLKAYPKKAPAVIDAYGCVRYMCERHQAELSDVSVDLRYESVSVFWLNDNGTEYAPRERVIVVAEDVLPKQGAIYLHLDAIPAFFESGFEIRTKPTVDTPSPATMQRQLAEYVTYVRKTTTSITAAVTTPAETDVTRDHRLCVGGTFIPFRFASSFETLVAEFLPCAGLPEKDRDRL